MSSPFRNYKKCRYSYFNISPSISFLTEDVLPFSKRQTVSLFVFRYKSNVSGFQLMALWNGETKRTIRGLFTNRFAPKQYRGVMGGMMVMGELV